VHLLKILLIAVSCLVGVLVTAGIICYGIGASLPVDHTATVTGVVAAPPAKVFAIITNVGAGASWRSQVKSVQVLPPDAGRDHWVETLGRGQTMSFLALRTEAPQPYGPAVGPETVVARRSVQLADPGSAYGGTWLYELSPTLTNQGDQATLLKITETGFINPPLYRFMMVHVMGMTANLDQYLRDIQAQAKRS
jgi:hypothetical protein